MQPGQTPTFIAAFSDRARPQRLAWTSDAGPVRGVWVHLDRRDPGRARGCDRVMRRPEPALRQKKSAAHWAAP